MRIISLTVRTKSNVYNARATLEDANRLKQFRHAWWYRDEWEDFSQVDGVSAERRPYATLRRLCLAAVVTEDQAVALVSGEISALWNSPLSSGIRPASILKELEMNFSLQGVACFYLWHDLQKLELGVLQALLQSWPYFVKKYCTAIMNQMSSFVSFIQHPDNQSGSFSKNSGIEWRRICV